ncbi:MAG: 16S rRNA (guanine(527)-N(7))-methyltransferase RsmG [Clostridia bacterium]|jgi:16S rRNA (guanine527-N7)-methyltransferase|nr:16S rRNA (guanine(527)-N(7))-methyltransferase RsmG [Clostridia bacterium]
MNKDAFRELISELDIALNEGQLEQFAQYYQELLDWNSRVNLTAITGEKEVLIKHFYDSLLVMKLPEWSGQDRIIDVGTGAGFPGIPLKIANPLLQVQLLDSLQKRVHFLEHIIRVLKLDKITALHMRAEEAGRDKGLRGQYDAAVSRAVARLPVLLELCLPLVRTGGWFFAYKGPEAPQEVEEAQEALRLLQGQIVRVEKTALPQDSGERYILIIRKTGPTSTAYPRKPGTPEKKPL